MSSKPLTPTGHVSLAADPSGAAVVGDTYYNTTTDCLRTCITAGTPGIYTNVVEHFDFCRPTGFKAVTFDRRGRVFAALAALVSGRETMALIQLNAGTVVSNATFHCLTTAAGTPTNQWFTLRDYSRNLLRVTSDDTTTAWSSGSAKTLTYATPYTVTADAAFYVGIMVKATTVPALAGASGNGAFIYTDPPITDGFANTGLTNPASAPATASALTASVLQVYAGVG